MATPLHVSFAAGRSGSWKINSMTRVSGDALPYAERLAVIEGSNASGIAAQTWVLQGVTSNTRYTNRSEVSDLSARQESLLRPHATRAALIPIRKSAAWWDLAQDERRMIFAEQSRHIGIGMDYLPAVARRLHHSRELGEPFDFLTWFEFEPADNDAFDHMLVRLRSTAEWRYVDREIDIRLSR